ncbi:MAG: hypothetical protein ACI8XO_000020 [Verrucomicrobiales bacterium]|jgi:hypothetical protein
MKPQLLLLLFFVISSTSLSASSSARLWNEQNLDAIRLDFPSPTVHARNLFHSSIAMWDAWAAYDPVALGYLHREDATAADVPSARNETISYAAFRVLSQRYLRSTNSAISVAALRTQMLDLGYDPDFDSSDGSSPAALGNRIAQTVLNFYSDDGSNESSNYTDNSYQPRNLPLILENSGTTMIDPNRWQPLAFDVAQTQNGQVADKVQIFVGSHWGQVRPFAMSLANGAEVYHDPGEPPKLGTATDPEFKEANLVVLRRSRDLDPTRPAMIDISPNAVGNNTLGKNDGSGYTSNPTTSAPYAPNVVPLGDYGRVLAEFWADGPESETPPGHWNTLANTITEHPDFEPRLGGIGAPVSQLEWDVKIYFALNAALHDAAIAAWGCKRAYDYVRPISSIRYLADRATLPLEPGLVELVTAETSALGQRHEGLAIGKLAIQAWGGEPVDPENEFTGAKWIHAEDWLPYQRDTFVTPAFAGYVSGHSCFSRAAAEVMTAMTGSPYFPGGLGTFTALANEFLEFEQGPSVEVQLQWATYYDAADEAGISRLYGGIHVPADDGPGRIIGSECGIAAYRLAAKYFDASILAEPVALDVEASHGGNYNFIWTAKRGLNYQLEFSTDLSFWVPAIPKVLSSETSMSQSYDPTPSGRDSIYFRIVQQP